MDDTTRDIIRNEVSKKLSRLDLRRIVDEITAEVVAQNIKDVNFPPASIPWSAIDWTGWTLEQHQTHLEKFKDFASTGITDTASLTRLEVSDGGVRINGTMSADNLDVRGKIKWGDPVLAKIVESVTSQVMFKFSKEIDSLEWITTSLKELRGGESTDNSS